MNILRTIIRRLVDDPVEKLAQSFLGFTPSSPGLSSPGKRVFVSEMAGDNSLDESFSASSSGGYTEFAEQVCEDMRGVSPHFGFSYKNDI